MLGLPAPYFLCIPYPIHLSSGSHSGDLGLGTRKYADDRIVVQLLTVLVCLLPAILVCGLELGLALYRCWLCALAVFIVMELIFLLHYYAEGSKGCVPRYFAYVCIQNGKLLITMWVTIHLLCFGVFPKNTKKLRCHTSFLYISDAS